MVLRLNRYQFYLRLTMYVLPAIAFGLAALGRHAMPVAALHYGWHYLVFWLVVTAAWSIIVAQYQLYSVDYLIRENTGLRRPLGATLALATVLGLVLYFSRETSLSRIVVALTCVGMFIMTVIVRLGFREALRRRVIRGRPLRILMIGADEFARHIERRLRTTPLVPCTVLGYVRLPGQTVAVKGAKVYEVEEITSLDPGELDDIVVGVPLDQYGEVISIMDVLQHLCRPVRALLDLGDNIAIQTTPLRIGRYQVLDLGTMPVETVQYQFIKRTFDLVFSMAAVILAAPLMIAVAIAIKASSPGPIFFRQDRVGFNGERFRMLKFRSMVVNRSSDTAHTSSADPRVTRVGQFLRKTSLDELPQFFNVLAGDMSVVGPRPELTFFVHKFRNEIPAYMSRHTMKCGITGWAQVNGLRGSDTSIATRVQYDIEYIRNWSLGLDLRIILLTIISGFAGRNAF